MHVKYIEISIIILSYLCIYSEGVIDIRFKISIKILMYLEVHFKLILQKILFNKFPLCSECNIPVPISVLNNLECKLIIQYN